METKQAWIKIYNTWKGGRREILNILVDLYEYNPVNGFYRCCGYREFSHGGMQRIDYVADSDIVKIIN